MIRSRYGLALAASLAAVVVGPESAAAARHRCADVPDGLFSGDRYQVNGDDTFTDMKTGLQWHQWTEESGSPGLNWTNGGSDICGGVFWWLHTQFNDGAAHRVELTPTETCFADRCDWRVPTVEEAWTLIDVGSACEDSCTSIPGDQDYPIWTSTGAEGYEARYAPFEVFVVDLVSGDTRVESKSEIFGLRPVRGEIGTGRALMLRDAAVAAVATWSDLLCFLDDSRCACFRAIAEAESGAPKFEDWRARMGDVRASCLADEPERTLSGMAQEAAFLACG